jgi:hypothetical protein
MVLQMGLVTCSIFMAKNAKSRRYSVALHVFNRSWKQAGILILELFRLWVLGIIISFVHLTSQHFALLLQNLSQVFTPHLFDGFSYFRRFS